MATSGLWHSDDDEWGRNSVSRESRDSSDDSSSDEEQVTHRLTQHPHLLVAQYASELQLQVDLPNFTVSLQSKPCLLYRKLLLQVGKM